MTAYLGFDVLDVVEHNRSEPLTEIVERAFYDLDTKTGVRTSRIITKGPKPVRRFHWTAFTRAAAAAMREFLDARKGRAVPFWLPSYQADLALSAGVSAGASLMPLRLAYYKRLMFPMVGARRHIAIHRKGQTLIYRSIVDADDPGDGVNETVTISSPLGAPLTVAGTTLMFLKLCRLEDDVNETAWCNARRGITDAIIRVRELPNEAPVPE